MRIAALSPFVDRRHGTERALAETLQRLEQEQRDFQDFLGRLRLAKDKAEFDQFVAERNARSGSTPQPQA